jgi:predicted DNA-binding ArsR family transcriptional regulator
MGRIDRELQKKLLTDLSEIYPQSANIERSYREHDIDEVLAPNLRYLEEFGLVSINWSPLTSTSPARPHSACVTARGIDFMTDDGGLSAILGVVTVKLHEDTIKALLVDQVNASSEPVTVKKRLIEQIKSLPADLTRQAVLDLAQRGAGQIPDLALWLGRLSGLSG